MPLAWRPGRGIVPTGFVAEDHMAFKLNAGTGIVAGMVLVIGAAGAWMAHSTQPEATALPPVGIQRDRQ